MIFFLSISEFIFSKNHPHPLVRKGEAHTFCPERAGTQSEKLALIKKRGTFHFPQKRGNMWKLTCMVSILKEGSVPTQ